MRRILFESLIEKEIRIFVVDRRILVLNIVEKSDLKFFIFFVKKMCVLIS